MMAPMADFTPVFNPFDWYWIVGSNESQVFSSKTGTFVPIGNKDYVAFLAAGNRPSRILNEAELGEVLAPYNIRPAAETVLDAYKDSQSRKLTLEVVAKVLFNLVNEVRALKGQQPVTAQQFRSYVKDLM